MFPSHSDNATNLKRAAPTLSPAVLARIAVAPIPLFVMQPGLAFAMDAMRRRHPDLFDRLSSLDDPTYLIDPTDLPLAFKLSLYPDRPGLRALRQADEAIAAATIRGSLTALLDLLQGRVDGDALFFSRALVIEGDTGAVVALRNAIESIEVDLLDDLLSSLGPLANPARHAITLGNRVLDRANRDLATVRSTILAGNTDGG